MFEQPKDKDGTENVVVLMTEYYYDSEKVGMMRVMLDDDFDDAKGGAEERIFTGYNFDLTSAYYTSSSTAYAVGYDRNNYMTYVILFDYNGSSALWPIKGLSSENPNSSPFAGRLYPHLNSLIYAVNTNGDDFPVKGYIVGSTKSIWSYSDCVDPNFINFSQPNY